MSAFNWFTTRERAFELRTKAVTTTYTVTVGSVANNFIEDRVITVANVATSFTITVPNGQYPGQRVLISLVGNASAQTLTVTCTVGTDYTLATAGMYVSLEWTNATTGWVALASSTTT